MNFKVKKAILLASESPRRQELLEKVGIPFQAVSSDVEEKFEAKPKDLHAYVTELAVEKAVAVANEAVDHVVIGADTVVSFKGQVFPKPANSEEAKQFLQTLSGKTHVVITAVAIVNEGDVRTFVTETQVTFYELDEALIDAYIASGDPLDKAGAYGIQSGGSLFVKGIDGDYYAVMGLPIARLAIVLQAMNLLEVEGRVVGE